MTYRTSVKCNTQACADPESFVRGGPTLTTFFRGERILIPPNGVSLACPLWPNIECWLGSFETFENFRGSGPVLQRSPIFLWFFRGVRTPAPPLPPSWSAHAKFDKILTKCMLIFCRSWREFQQVSPFIHWWAWSALRLWLHHALQRIRLCHKQKTDDTGTKTGETNRSKLT